MTILFGITGRMFCLQNTRKTLLKQWPVKPAYSLKRSYHWYMVGPQFLQYISETRVCHAFGELLVYSHDTLGLPWWGAITTLAVGARVLMFPLALSAQKKTAFQQNLFLELGRRLKKKIELERRKRGWSEEMARKEFLRQFTDQKQLVSMRNNISQSGILLQSLLPIPLWIILTLSLRNLCGGLHFIPGDIEPILSMCREGIFWFPNLLQGDIVLPTILGSLTACSLLLSFHTQPTYTPDMTYQRVQQFIKIGSQAGFAVIMVLIAYSSPAAMSYLWTLSVLTGLTQQICLNHRVTKKKLGILPLKWDLGAKENTFHANLQKKL